ncbi:arylsulfatase [Blastopirellula sp. JC732]|uniref:Arylsulfatase n=1 Tax=Blastopirellula sediminis TaxID=2894196 RepID=A0A9X1SIP6_9BACT|nr:arylsulfatase [Blastopirellula sediminis]MCC9605654.1 arylsulfatase [Blastopirellula sediminis]MCC9631046.1 arylsulfatase [Blastopirellula sediminis]
MTRRIRFLSLCVALLWSATALAADKPNILFIMGDDIGMWNISTYHQGMMGYSTPNIDRLAKEGGKFMSYYAQQSCTAGRSAFITGQMPFRTGLSKVGLPGADLGLQKEDPTLAEILKPMGYVTGQFGKNHLGDKDEFLPTNHGFDEFLGNLYHLNAEEEPENPDYPKNPEFKKKFGPRGVIKSSADGKIEDTGPLTMKRMETIDEEVLAATTDFIDRAKKADKPFFVWFNTTHMHNFTHVKPEDMGKTGLGFYADGMVYHDAIIGKLLDYVDKAGLTENTIVVYTTDNGPMTCLWPDGGMTPFRSEKNTNWDGGWRVPALIRWPGVVEPGTLLTDTFSAEDWFPTLAAAAGDADIKEKLLKGHKAGDMTYKVHLDGYNQSDYLAGKAPSARKEFFYFSDDGDLLALRYDRWKVHFMIQEATGIEVWRHPFTTLRAPIIFDLKVDPFEKGQDGMGYEDWWYRRAFVLVPSQAIVGNLMETFVAYPPRQKPASFTVGEALEKLSQPSAGGN